ncbi:MAG: DMT family transporter [Oscillochloris sp.]|nr:DMT family transporter [Oscillochloris sp.]
MAGALFSFMAMAIAGRQLSADLTTFQILFFRSAIGLIVVVGLLLRGSRRFASNRLGLHLLRNVAHFGGQYGWFYGLAFIPLAQVFAIEFTVPIWTALMAVPFLGERLSRPRMAAVGLGVIGLLLILRPGLDAVHPAALAVLGGAVLFAISNIATKKLAASEAPLTILFYMTFVQLVLSLFPAISDWILPAAWMWPWLLVVGLSALSAHYCMASAFALADATVVVPMDFLRLPLIALVGAIFYGEPLEWLVLVGGALMLFGNWINIQAERRREAL